jgi:hypothetical protein
MRLNKSARSGPLAVTKKKFAGKHRCRSTDRGEEKSERGFPAGSALISAGARQRKSSAAASAATNSAGFHREQPEPCGLVISPVLEWLRRFASAPFEPHLKFES